MVQFNYSMGLDWEDRTIGSMDRAVDRMNPRTIRQSYRHEFMPRFQELYWENVLAYLNMDKPVLVSSYDNSIKST